MNQFNEKYDDVMVEGTKKVIGKGDNEIHVFLEDGYLTIKQKDDNNKRVSVVIDNSDVAELIKTLKTVK